VGVSVTGLMLFFGFCFYLWVFVPIVVHYIRIVFVSLFKKFLSNFSTDRHYFKHACITRILSYFKDCNSPLRHEFTLNCTATRSDTYRKCKLSVLGDDYYGIITIKPLCFPIVYDNILYDILWRKDKSHRSVLLRLILKIDNIGPREHSYRNSSMIQLNSLRFYSLFVYIS
jgi:hypothetical protein